MLRSFKPPKDTKDYEWTNHVVRKMQYYRLPESRIKRVVRYPKRKEEGIAPGTVAVMTPRKIASRSRGKPSKRLWDEEIWVMYLEIGNPSTDSGRTGVRKRIISAWRYPGMSPKGSEIPIPDDIREELEGPAP